MGFSPASQIVNPAKWQAPVSEDILMKGAILAEQDVKDFQKEFQESSTDVLFGIKPMSPQDEKVLRQRQQEYMNDVSQVSVADLNSPQSRTFLNQIKAKYANDPDILAIAERSAKYYSDIKTYNELLEKGKPISDWRQKSLRQAQKYINDGIYYTDVRFTGNITVDPNISKTINSAIKLAHSSADQEWTYNPKTGKYTGSKSVSPEKIFNSIYSQIQSDPQVIQYYTDLFEYETPDYNPKDDAESTYNEFVALSTDIINNPHSDPQDVENAKHILKQLQSAKSSPEFINRMHSLKVSNFIKDQLQKHVDAYSFTQELKPKYDELYIAKQKADIQATKELKEFAGKQYMNSEGFTLDDRGNPIIPPGAKVAAGSSYEGKYKKTQADRDREREFSLFNDNIVAYVKSTITDKKVKTALGLPENAIIAANGVKDSGNSIIITYDNPMGNSGISHRISKEEARITLKDLKFKGMSNTSKGIAD